MGRFKLLLKAIANRLLMNENVTAVIKYHAVRQYPKVQRNDLCPCGSGRKYKACCQAAKRNPWRKKRSINH
jgi:uncharacterized protein YecA (UPF0149 family)